MHGIDTGVVVVGMGAVMDWIDHCWMVPADEWVIVVGVVAAVNGAEGGDCRGDDIDDC